MHIKAVLSVSLDISERKTSEAELAKHREHLEELVEERTQKLQARNEELEALHKNIVGREFRIKELRNQEYQTALNGLIKLIAKLNKPVARA